MQRIVVGVDGSDNAHAALAWAVEEAKFRDASVDAVMVWHDTYYYGGTMAIPIPTDMAEVEASYSARLAEIIASVDGADDVNPVLREGSAASCLLSEGAKADLLVVGSRGHGGFVGLLLGSVANQVVAHATCPVVVVPAVPEADD